MLADLARQSRCLQTADVRRIADNEIKIGPRTARGFHKRIQQIRFVKLDLPGHSMASCVPPRIFECGC